MFKLEVVEHLSTRDHGEGRNVIEQVEHILQKLSLAS